MYFYCSTVLMDPQCTVLSLSLPWFSAWGTLQHHRVTQTCASTSPLLQAGHTTLMLEQGKFPRSDTDCTCCLERESVHFYYLLTFVRTSGMPEQIWVKHMRLLFWLSFIQIQRQLAECSRTEKHTEQPWKHFRCAEWVLQRATEGPWSCKSCKPQQDLAVHIKLWCHSMPMCHCHPAVGSSGTSPRRQIPKGRHPQDCLQNRQREQRVQRQLCSVLGCPPSAPA